MLNEGVYCKPLDENGNYLGIIKVWNDGSHHLKIVSTNLADDTATAIKVPDYALKQLYCLLKSHFEGTEVEEDKRNPICYEAYVRYVSDMLNEDCPFNEIATYQQWEAEIKEIFKEKLEEGEAK